jgi:nitrogen regulatory protein P-II 2
MKLVEAVIQKLKLQEVRNALDEMGVEDFRESSVICHGQHGETMRFRGAELVVNMVERVKVEIIAADDVAVKIINVISSIAKTGNKQDCHIGVRSYLEVC